MVSIFWAAGLFSAPLAVANVIRARLLAGLVIICKEKPTFCSHNLDLYLRVPQQPCECAPRETGTNHAYKVFCLLWGRFPNNLENPTSHVGHGPTARYNANARGPRAYKSSVKYCRGLVCRGTYLRFEQQPRDAAGVTRLYTSRVARQRSHWIDGPTASPCGNAPNTPPALGSWTSHICSILSAPFWVVCCRHVARTNASRGKTNPYLGGVFLPPLFMLVRPRRRRVFARSARGDDRREKEASCHSHQKGPHVEPWLLSPHAHTHVLSLDRDGVFQPMRARTGGARTCGS